MSTGKEKRLFGTNGVRGVVGKEMTPDLAMKIGMAIATIRPGTIAVGRDTRTSGPALSCAVKAGILACGCDVVDVGILPTPALQYLVSRYYDAGAMITASHNPPEYNGVKAIDTDGTEMSDEDSIRLEERIFGEDFAVRDWRGVGRETQAPHLVHEYIEAIVAAFPDRAGDGMVVAVDPGSGPGAITTPEILRRMGCRVHTINAQMDGTFPGRLPEPSPEELLDLATLVTETGADFGVAHDGDADRAVFIDEKGEYVEENEEFALIQRFVCRGRQGTVVTPVSTSRLVEAMAKETGCRVTYTPVGSIYVARTMRAGGDEVLFGGEGNGGLIFPGHQYCRDGAMTAAVMVSLLAGNRPLSALREELPPYHMIREKIHTSRAGEVLEWVKERYSEENLDFTDGVRLNRPSAWALLRPSGTEPFMRLYVEAEQPEEAEALSLELMAVIRDFLHE